MVRVYGATWCGDTQDAITWLREMGEELQFLDVDASVHARAHVLAVAGKMKTPVLEFEDGTSLITPTHAQLREKIHEVTGKTV